jgi:hypothetical protein
MLFYFLIFYIVTFLYFRSRFRLILLLLHAIHLVLHLAKLLLSRAGNVEYRKYEPYNESEYHYKDKRPKEKSEQHKGSKVVIPLYQPR